MFTFKKFAVLAISGFIATSMFACSDTTDEEDDPDAVPPNYILEDNEAALGGANNSVYGSSLDIDVTPFKVYKIGELTATVVDKIDLIFDGTNIWTPNSIKVSTDATAATLKAKYANANSGAFIFAVPANITTDEQAIINAYNDALDDNADDLIINNTSVGKKFGVQSSTGNILALVEIKDKDPAAGVSIRLTLTTVE